MSGAFAEMFNAQARPLLWRTHAETVLLRDDQGERDLQVIWQREKPDAQEQDGLGLDGYTGTARAIVQIADLPEPHGQLTLVRHGETWQLRRVELQDQWTWRFFMSQAKPEIRLPEGLRG